jgi:hypothetical protein
MSVLHYEDADEPAATAAFAAARSRFAGATPAFVWSPDGTRLLRPIPTAPAGALQTLHVLNWDPYEESLMRTNLPLALLRLNDDPIEIIDSQAGEPRGVSLRISDIERFGPALLVDQQLEDGRRILVWTD